MNDMNNTNDPGAGLASQSSASGEEVADLYDTWASGGDYDRDVESWGYEAPEHIADQTLAATAVVPGEVLDAGCGTGRLGTALRERGVHDIVGGDFTPVSIEAARARGARGTRGGPASEQRGDGRGLGRRRRPLLRQAEVVSRTR